MNQITKIINKKNPTETMKLFFAICIEDCKNREQEQGSQQVSSVEK